MCMCTLPCVTHRHYRSKSKAPAGTPQNFYSESIFRDAISRGRSLEMRDQIRSRDIRNILTPLREFFVPSFLSPPLLFRFNFDSKYYRLMLHKITGGCYNVE